MRILIVGAGALGGYFGAWLLHAGRDVTFLVRPARAAQLAANGLHLESPAGNLHLPAPQTVLATDFKQPYDLILLSPKAFDLERAIEDFAPAVGPQTAILPLLNGMAHMQTLDQRFGREHVLGGETVVSAIRTEDGRILHLNALDTLRFGHRDHPDSERMLAIEAFLTVPGYTTLRAPDILHEMWQKWVAISSAASITCLMRATIADIINAGAGPLVTTLLEETASIATAEGYPPSAPFLAVCRTRFTQPGSLFTTSMSRDIEANFPIEADHIIGDLLAHAQRHSVPTPLLEVVYAHLRSYEERRKREAHATPA